MPNELQADKDWIWLLGLDKQGRGGDLGKQLWNVRDMPWFVAGKGSYKRKMILGILWNLIFKIKSYPPFTSTNI